MIGFTDSEVRNLIKSTSKKELPKEELVGEITTQFNLERDFYEEDFLSLLFYLGFLTIDEEELMDVIYKVPNEAVKGIYFDYFAKKL